MTATNVANILKLLRPDDVRTDKTGIMSGDGEVLFDTNIKEKHSGWVTLKHQVLFSGSKNEDWQGPYYYDIQVKNISKERLKQIAKDIIESEYPDCIGYRIMVIGVRKLPGIGMDLPTTQNIAEMPLKQIKIMPLQFEIKANEEIIDENVGCVWNYLDNIKHEFRITRKLSKLMKDVKKLGNYINYWNVNKFHKFLADNGIGHTIMTRWLVPLYEYFENKNKRNIIHFIVSNEHLYSLTKEEYMLLKNYDMTNIKIEKYIPLIESITPEELHNEYIIPNYIKLSNVESNLTDNMRISKYVHNKSLYMNKDDCIMLDLFQKIGITVPLTYKLTRFTPLINIANLKGLWSNNPGLIGGVKPLLINRGVTNNLDKHYTVDKNKCHLNTMINLKYIPIIDETIQFEEYDNQPLKDWYFYYIDDIKDESYANIYNLGYTTGFRLSVLNSEELNNIKITHILKPKLVENPYSNIFKNLYLEAMKTKNHYVVNLVKETANKWIGMIQICKNNIPEKLVFNSIVDNEYERNKAEEDGYLSVQLNGKYALFKTYVNDKKYLQNMLGLAHYIVDINVKIILSKCIELTDKGAVIKGIRTDSITFQTVNQDIINKVFKISNLIGDWKYEEVKKSKIYYSETIKNRKHEMQNIVYNKDIDISQLLDSNVYSNNDAGCGKTTLIHDKLLPLLNDNYMIICSQGSPLDCYRGQHRAYTIDYISAMRYNPFKKYKYVIIEEAGLTKGSQWSWLINNITINNKIWAIGDSDQLPPVGDNYNHFGKDYVKSLFGIKLIINENHRNNFTKEEYSLLKRNIIPENIEKILEGKIKEFPEEGEYVELTEYNICYFHETRKKINEIYTKDWTDIITIGDKEKYQLKVKIGGKLICKQNNYKYGLFNNSLYVIEEYTENTLTLKSTTNNIIILSINEHVKLEHGYALTLYCCQSKSIPYEDISFWDFGDYSRFNNAIYTAISRILLHRN